jgi:hypothetical protein
VIGHDRNAITRVPFPEKFDLLDCGGKIIAGMNSDKQLLLLRGIGCGQIVGA